MRIIKLTAENFKRLRAVEIEPDGAVVVVRGKNAQGKSSVLDAIWAALGGKRAVPGKPIREGSLSGLPRQVGARDKMISPWYVIEFGVIMAGLFGVGIAVRWVINNAGHACRELDERVRRQRRDIPIIGKP